MSWGRGLCGSGALGLRTHSHEGSGTVAAQRQMAALGRAGKESGQRQQRGRRGTFVGSGGLSFLPSFLLSSGVSARPHPLELRIQGPGGRWRTQGTIRTRAKGQWPSRVGGNGETPGLGLITAAPTCTRSLWGDRKGREGPPLPPWTLASCQRGGCGPVPAATDPCACPPAPWLA